MVLFLPSSLSLISSTFLPACLSGLLQSVRFEHIPSFSMLRVTSFLFLQAVQASKLVPAYRAIMMGLEGEGGKARLATEFVTLATTLKAEGKWRKAREEVLSEPSTLSLVSSVLRAEREEEGLIRKALDIIRSADYTMVEEKTSSEDEQTQLVLQRSETMMSSEQALRIDQMLEKVAENLAQSSLEPVVTEVMNKITFMFY